MMPISAFVILQKVFSYDTNKELFNVLGIIFEVFILYSLTNIARW